MNSHYLSSSLAIHCAGESPPVQARAFGVGAPGPWTGPVRTFQSKHPFPLYARSASYPEGRDCGSIEEGENSSRAVPLIDFCTSIRRTNVKRSPSSLPVSMDTVGVVHYNGTDKPSPHRIIECLLLPHTDDTQTALANENIHVSETQTIQWRTVARENSIIITGNNQDQRRKHHACVPRRSASSCIIS